MSVVPTDLGGGTPRGPGRSPFSAHRDGGTGGRDLPRAAEGGCAQPDPQLQVRFLLINSNYP